MSTAAEKKRKAEIYSSQDKLIELKKKEEKDAEKQLLEGVFGKNLF